ncbi:MAG: hypothetical protein EOP82_26505 [Variovorax sp.]|nr:MAG: hypothetical protein EOP82_26505 [Variovorax sp.]
MYRPYAAAAGQGVVFEEEFTFNGFPQPVLDALRAKDERAAIQRAVAAGFRDENTLTDLVFFSRHPERQGAPLSRGEPDASRLVAEWLDIRDRLVRGTPRAPAGAAPPSSYVPAPPAVAPVGRPPSISTSFITIASGARLTPQIEAVVKALDAHFRSANLKVMLSSGYRSPQDQLRLIREQAIKRGLDRLYPSITTATVENGESWIGAWDDLLHRQKYIINPPVPTESRIVPGKTYGASPHSTGLAFDLSRADLDRIAGVVRGYCQQGGPIRQILVERRNGAVHVGIDGSGKRGTCQISYSN